MIEVTFGSFTTDAFSIRADQCPLLLRHRHDCSAQRSDARGHLLPYAPQQTMQFIRLLCRRPQPLRVLRCGDFASP